MRKRANRGESRGKPVRKKREHTFRRELGHRLHRNMAIITRVAFSGTGKRIGGPHRDALPVIWKLNKAESTTKKKKPYKGETEL